MTMPPDIASEQGEQGEQGEPEQEEQQEPLLPTQSREDTDVGWGDYGERDDNDRLLRDRPPHWDDA
jgi:hypothetical protein